VVEEGREEMKTEVLARGFLLALSDESALRFLVFFSLVGTGACGLTEVSWEEEGRRRKYDARSRPLQRPSRLPAEP
jgi:hypothetical protein